MKESRNKSADSDNEFTQDKIIEHEGYFNTADAFKLK